MKCRFSAWLTEFVRLEVPKFALVTPDPEADMARVVVLSSVRVSIVRPVPHVKALEIKEIDPSTSSVLAAAANGKVTWKSPAPLPTVGVKVSTISTYTRLPIFTYAAACNV